MQVRPREIAASNGRGRALIDGIRLDRTSE